jgi:hypothetical protein
MGPSGFPFFRSSEMSSDTAFVAIMAVVALVGLGTTFKFLLRFIELRDERSRQTRPDALASLSERLDRIENAVDTTALEVERIAESNRFMAKLLAERNTAPSAPPPPAKSGRVITPH